MIEKYKQLSRTIDSNGRKALTRPLASALHTPRASHQQNKNDSEYNQKPGGKQSGGILRSPIVFYLNRRVNNAVVSIYKYASPKDSLPVYPDSPSAPIEQ
jgi:hypothetical protein